MVAGGDWDDWQQLVGSYFHFHSGCSGCRWTQPGIFLLASGAGIFIGIHDDLARPDATLLPAQPDLDLWLSRRAVWKSIVPDWVRFLYVVTTDWISVQDVPRRDGAS